MRRRLFRGAGSGGAGELHSAALAPMVDMITLVFVAVLRTWSADPPVRVPEGDFTLPRSVGETGAPLGLTLDIGKSGLYVDGYRVGSTEYWAASEHALITDLLEVLQARQGDKVVVRADQDTPWSMLSKVMYTAQQAGYADIELVAISRASL